MDQTLALIMHGCNLARQLEANLVHLAHKPESLSKSCDDILTLFLTCKERLLPSSADSQLLLRQPSTIPPPLPRNVVDHSGIHHWLNNPAMVERFQAQVLEMATGLSSMGTMEEVVEPSGGGNAPGVAAAASTLGGSDSAKVRAVATSSSGSQRRRRRRDETERRRIRVPDVPRTGNAEVPPAPEEDGFSRRKYGQKQILGSRFPRGYYRCTHQKLYQCPAKKQVQRLDNHPDTYQVTYRGQHTCHIYATAPSVAHPTAAAAVQQQQLLVTPSGLPSSSSSVGRWGLEFRLGAGGETVGPSSRYGGGVRDHHHEVDSSVADMAATMFSSGSSSRRNSMDMIFNAAAMDVLHPAAGDLDHDHSHYDDVRGFK